jgi:hypothetical protein
MTHKNYFVKIVGPLTGFALIANLAESKFDIAYISEAALILIIISIFFAVVGYFFRESRGLFDLIMYVVGMTFLHLLIHLTFFKGFELWGFSEEITLKLIGLMFLGVVTLVLAFFRHILGWRFKEVKKQKEH